MNKYFNSKNITRIAIFTALSYVLYLLGQFCKLPFFPANLELQFSDAPALLAGYMMGPLAGVCVIVLKTLLKLPMSSTGCVGELADLILGALFVLVSTLVYRRKRTLRGAIFSLVIGSIMTTLAAMLVNYVMLIPFFSKLYGFENVVSLMRAIIPSVTEGTFYAYYIFFAALPFNFLRCVICSLITFLLYKRLGRLFDRIFKNVGNTYSEKLQKTDKKSYNVTVKSKSERQTYKIAKRFASSLCGGEIILLDGELGAGKTVFVKGLAAGLGIRDEVTSPTFALMNAYEGESLNLYHFDVYRLKSGTEAYEAGLTEYFGQKDGVCCVEWADNISEVIAGEIIRVGIAYDGEKTREITINGINEQTKSTTSRDGK